MEKKKARIEGRQKVCLLTPDQRASGAEAIRRRLENLPELARAKVIMAYAPLPDEVDLLPLWRRLAAAGRRIVFPFIVDADGFMEAVPVADCDAGLTPGRFKIPQPAGGPPVDPRAIDIVIVPAIAFDLHGHRLGRGGGYYDRFLSAQAPQAFRLGVAFECQIVDRLPIREHDCPMSAVLTEKGLRRFNSAANCLSDVV